MTIISSGQLALQNAGTNPTTTVDNIPLPTTITPGVDSSVSIYRYMESEFGFAYTRQWAGPIYGYSAVNGYLDNGTAGSGSIFNSILGEVGGVSAGSCWFSASPGSAGMGTAGSNTFVDGSGTTRTITGALWGIPDSNSPSPNNNTRWFILAIAGTGIPNSDTTFNKVVVGSSTGSAGATFVRSDATVAYNADDGNSVWVWEYDTTYSSVIDGGLGTNTNTKTFKVHLADTTISLNNGIAEEFGGDDSSNVTLSQYYAGGIYTPASTTGVPTTGQIKFSDFFGTSKLITNAWSATGTNNSWGKAGLQRIGRVITSYYVGQAQGSGGTPSPLSTDGFGISLTTQTAAWYEGQTTGTTGFRWEATGSSNDANTTWWNKVTISRSGQTDVVLLRSAATTNAMANFRYSIFWPEPTANYIALGEFTWTFSSEA